MFFLVFVPLFIGTLGVLQHTLNRRFADSIGVPLALAVNSGVMIACAGIFYAYLRFAPERFVPPLYRIGGGLSALSPWHILQGAFGFFIIATAPVAIERIGATRVFIGIIVAQIVASILWDYFFEARPPDPYRIAGAALALGGALLAAR